MCALLAKLKKKTAKQEEVKKLNASFRERRKGHTAKKLNVENKETADREQWTHGLHSYCKDRFTDQIRDGLEQTVGEWAARDPLQEKPHIHRDVCSLGGDENSQGPGRRSSDGGNVAEPPDTIEAQSDSPL